MCVDMKASLGESRGRTVRSVSRREVLHAHSSTLFKSGEFITGDFSPFRATHSTMMTTLILLLTTLGFFPQGQTLFISTVWWSAESGNLHFPHWQCSPTVLEVLFIHIFHLSLSLFTLSLSSFSFFPVFLLISIIFFFLFSHGPLHREYRGNNL